MAYVTRKKGQWKKGQSVTRKPNRPNAKPTTLSTIANILHNQRGTYIEGKTCFFDYMVAKPVKDYYNIGYIRDIPHIQLEDGGFSDNKIKAIFKKHNAMVHNLDAFVTMTDALANHITDVYDLNIPYTLFQNYPSWIETPVEKRDEFVYIGAKPIKFKQHESYLTDIEKATDIKVSWKYYDKSVPIRAHLTGYDYSSKYGLAVNATDFNQVGEALNRKILLYLMCGMKPVIHTPFTSAISFIEKWGIKPLVFDNPDDIAQRISTHDFGTIDRKQFCIETRMPDLLAKLKTMGA